MEKEKFRERVKTSECLIKIFYLMYPDIMALYCLERSLYGSRGRRLLRITVCNKSAYPIPIHPLIFLF